MANIESLLTRDTDISCYNLNHTYALQYGKGIKSAENKSIKRILVIDDEYDISLTIKVVLEENGFKVDSFINASDALENFRTGLYDLVILDVKMPEIDGFILYERIKKLDDKVAICFLTAADDAFYAISKKKHPSINENCVIHKPVDNESLLRKIKSVLTRQLPDIEGNKQWQKLCVQDAAFCGTLQHNVA